MKKVISLIILVFASFLLVSCENKDEVADEIVQYYNEELLPMYEKKANKTDEKPYKLTQLEDDNKKEEAIDLVKDEAMPIIDEALERLEAADPPNKKNERYANRSGTVCKRIKKLIDYFKDNDVSEQDIEKRNEKLEEKYLDVFDYREELMDQYNLVEEDDSDYPKLKCAG